MSHETVAHEPAAARRGERIGLPTATMLSLILHLFLAAGLTQTGLGILSLPTPDAPAEARNIFRPKPARDFPLEVSRSQSETAAHERPFDLPIATGRTGQRPQSDRSRAVSRPTPPDQAHDLRPQSQLPERSRQSLDREPSPAPSPERAQPAMPASETAASVPGLAAKTEAAPMLKPTVPQRRSRAEYQEDRTAAVAPRFPREVAVLSRAPSLPPPALQQMANETAASPAPPPSMIARQAADSARSPEASVTATPLPADQPSVANAPPQFQARPRSTLPPRATGAATTNTAKAQLNAASGVDLSATGPPSSTAPLIAGMARRQSDGAATSAPSFEAAARSLPRSAFAGEATAAGGTAGSAIAAPLTMASDDTGSEHGAAASEAPTSTGTPASTPRLSAPSFARISAAGRPRAGISPAAGRPPDGDFAGDRDGDGGTVFEEGLSTDGMALADLSLASVSARRQVREIRSPAFPEATALPRALAIVLPVEPRPREIALPFRRRMARKRLPHDADEVVDRGLDFLKRAQQDDGRWRLEAYPGAAGEPAPKLFSDTAATGLALLSFLGAGHDHFDGECADTVRRGLEFLISIQKEDGDLYLPADPLSNSCSWMYSHGIATMALCEAVGMTGDDHLRPAAAKACGFIATTQHPSRKGWRYTPQSDADLSVSGWMLIALRSGKLAGVPIDEQALAGVRDLLDAATIPPSAGQSSLARFHYNEAKPEQRPAEISLACMTALGTLMRLHTGWRPEDEQPQENGRILAAILPAYAVQGQITRDCYLWYYASQVLVHTGGDAWDRWYAALVDVLRARQEQEGPLAGSWSPMGPIPDRWGRYGGRIYVTTLQLLTLEVPSRHLPTYSFGDGTH